jgi:hypothetical protein
MKPSRRCLVTMLLAICLANLFASPAEACFLRRRRCRQVCCQPCPPPLPPVCAYAVVFTRRSDGLLVFDSTFPTAPEADARVTLLRGAGDYSAFWKCFSK